MLDVGINLTHDGFDRDRDALLAHAQGVGVVGLIVTGTTLAVSGAARELASSRPGYLWSTAGVHPHHATEWDATTADGLRALLAAPEVVAVGECGLDLFRRLAPPDAQERAFAGQLALAVETGKPLFLHQRDAHARVLAMLREQRVGHGVAHCFTGDAAQAADYLALGLHIGVTGWLCDERRGADLRAAVTSVPRERLLVETDAPYLVPRDLALLPKPSRNEPAFLPHIVAALARLRGEDAAEVAAYTTANARRLFELPG